MKSDTDTPEQKLARSNEGGEKNKRSCTIDEIWNEIQAMNRAAGPWGMLHPPSAAFFDLPHDWRKDAERAVQTISPRSKP
ncbi:MAG TPA: hypothetical protein VMT67_13895 [Terriglobales bacterium]|nr:hypothetical protein [Terriglobales bacterium]